MLIALLVVPAALLLPASPFQVEVPGTESPARVQAQQRVKEGQRLMSEDRFAEAAEAFQRSIQLDPLLMMAHYGLGTARMALKEYPSAIAAFQAARDAFQKRAAENSDRRAAVQNAREARIRLLEAQMRDSPETSGERNRREGGQRQALRLELDELERLKEADGQASRPPPGLSLALGSAYFRTGQLADAEREYRAAIEAQPKLGEPRSNLAVVLLITGHPAEAKEQLKLAKKNGFKPPAGLEADIEAALAKGSSKKP